MSTGRHTIFHEMVTYSLALVPHHDDHYLIHLRNFIISATQPAMASRRDLLLLPTYRQLSQRTHPLSNNRGIEESDGQEQNEQGEDQEVCDS